MQQRRKLNQFPKMNKDVPKNRIPKAFIIYFFACMIVLFGLNQGSIEKMENGVRNKKNAVECANAVINGFKFGVIVGGATGLAGGMAGTVDGGRSKVSSKKIAVFCCFYSDNSLVLPIRKADTFLVSEKEWKMKQISIGETKKVVGGDKDLSRCLGSAAVGFVIGGAVGGSIGQLGGATGALLGVALGGMVGSALAVSNNPYCGTSSRAGQ
ncbi:hypothetical protein [Verminephrobacter aporrectodeae]|uniref:hypothetical protein n=1 Tax=Verminephrobacter aporrectodeae TaxID=1110389 RepID=UPI002237DCD8|nr:hypothetical protein [Verminephrobacter aporrectodeae]